MQYPGPEPSDLENVLALNRAFLDLVARGGSLHAIPHNLPDGMWGRLAGLVPKAADRLASVPFMMFSLRERDDEYWGSLLAPGDTPDLFRPVPAPDAGTGKLAAAGLGFAWQLARRNAYALRLLSGASLHWCEEIAARPLVDLLSRAASMSDIIELRCGDNAPFWDKLLDRGTSGRRDIRVAAHLTAWQQILTPEPASTGAWATAACRSRVPSLEVADKRRR
jgi:hypothetical protein